jgi:hypothetical protein
MLELSGFRDKSAICFGELSTARTALEFIARGEAVGVDDLPLVAKPEQLLDGHFLDLVFARMG